MNNNANPTQEEMQVFCELRNPWDFTFYGLFDGPKPNPRISSRNILTYPSGTNTSAMYTNDQAAVFVPEKTREEYAAQSASVIEAVMLGYSAYPGQQSTDPKELQRKLTILEEMHKDRPITDPRQFNLRDANRERSIDKLKEAIEYLLARDKPYTASEWEDIAKEATIEPRIMDEIIAFCLNKIFTNKSESKREDIICAVKRVFAVYNNRSKFVMHTAEWPLEVADDIKFLSQEFGLEFQNCHLTHQLKYFKIIASLVIDDRNEVAKHFGVQMPMKLNAISGGSMKILSTLLKFDDNALPNITKINFIVPFFPSSALWKVVGCCIDLDARGYLIEFIERCKRLGTYPEINLYHSINDLLVGNSAPEMLEMLERYGYPMDKVNFHITAHAHSKATKLPVENLDTDFTKIDTQFALDAYRKGDFDNKYGISFFSRLRNDFSDTRDDNAWNKNSEIIRDNQEWEERKRLEERSEDELIISDPRLQNIFQQTIAEQPPQMPGSHVEGEIPENKPPQKEFYDINERSTTYPPGHSTQTSDPAPVVFGTHQQMNIPEQKSTQNLRNEWPSNMPNGSPSGRIPPKLIPEARLSSAALSQHDLNERHHPAQEDSNMSVNSRYHSIQEIPSPSNESFYSAREEFPEECDWNYDMEESQPNSEMGSFAEIFNKGQRRGPQSCTF